MDHQNQHYLPRLLLRGFTTLEDLGPGRRGPWMFEYRPDGSGTARHVDEIAATDNFYGPPVEGGVEQKLGQEDETAFGKIIGRLRAHEGRVERPEQVALLPGFVAHLAFRTSWWRGFMMNFQETAYAAMEAELCDMVRKSWPPPFGDMAAHRIRARFAQEAAKTTNQVVGSQLRQLAGELAELTRTRKLDRLTWFVQQDSDGAFILGDLGPIGRGGDKATGLHAPIEYTEPELVVLPISHRSLLVGSRDQDVPTMDPADVNAASAELSREFFVAARLTATEEAYARRIGRRAQLRTADDWRADLRSHRTARRSAGVSRRDGSAREGRN